MAMRNVEIVVKVVDKAGKQLDGIENKIRRTGKSAKDSTIDLTKFNRTIFGLVATTALLSRSVNSLFSSMEAGGQYERLSNQYERIFGDKGVLFNSISNFTDAAIDKEDALKAAITLGNLGIVRNSEDAARALALGGAAARRAGKDTSEGIKEVTDFMQDGEIAHLQNLDIIKKTDVGMRLLDTVLHKYGGTIGGVIAPQVRMAVGMELMNKAVGPFMKGYQDGADIVKNFSSDLKILKDSIGRLLITALAPMVSSLRALAEKASSFVEKLNKNNKGILTLIKYGITAAVTLGTLSTAILVLRSSVLALNSLGLGIPALNANIILMGALFLGITNKAKDLSERFEIFGDFVKGVIQLISSFDEKTGKSKIGENLKKQLEKAGIYEFALVISKTFLIVKSLITDVVDLVVWSSKKIDDLLGALGYSFQKLVGVSFKEAWDNFWVNESMSPVHKAIRLVIVALEGLLAWWAGKKLFGAIGSVLGKIPGVGKLFGNKKGPLGTASDPMYVTETSGRGLIGEAAESVAGPKVLDSFSKRLFANLSIILGSSFSQLVAMLGTAGATAVTTMAIGAAGLAGHEIGGMIRNIIDEYTQGTTEEGFKGDIVDRSWFKLSKWTGIGNARDFIKYKQQIAAANAKVSALNKKSTPEVPVSSNINSAPMASIPASYDSQLQAAGGLLNTLESIHTSQKDSMRKTMEDALNNGYNTQDVVNTQVLNKEAVDAIYQGNDYLQGIHAALTKNKSSQVNPNVKNYIQSNGIKY